MFVSDGENIYNGQDFQVDDEPLGKFTQTNSEAAMWDMDRSFRQTQALQSALVDEFTAGVQDAVEAQWGMAESTMTDIIDELRRVKGYFEFLNGRVNALVAFLQEAKVVGLQATQMPRKALDF